MTQTTSAPQTFTKQLGTTVILVAFSENFDGVVAPALPAGWTTAASGVEVPWVTSTLLLTAPTTRFCSRPKPTSATPSWSARPLQWRLVEGRCSSGISTTWRARLTVCAGDQPSTAARFQDITAGGGSFTAVGITELFPLPSAAQLPVDQHGLVSRAARRLPPTYITTIANLPPAAAGQNVQLKFSRSDR